MINPKNPFLLEPVPMVHEQFQTTRREKKSLEEEKKKCEMQKDYQGPFRLRCAEVCRGALWKPLARRYTNVAVSRRVVDNAEFALTERVSVIV